MVGFGEIVVVVKIDDLYIGSMIGEKMLFLIFFLILMVGFVVFLKSWGDEIKLLGVFYKVVEEDFIFLLD